MENLSLHPQVISRLRRTCGRRPFSSTPSDAIPACDFNSAPESSTIHNTYYYYSFLYKKEVVDEVERKTCAYQSRA